jgi:hypothetical protein
MGYASYFNVLSPVPSRDNCAIANILLELLSKVWQVNTKYVGAIAMLLRESPKRLIEVQFFIAFYLGSFM